MEMEEKEKDFIKNVNIDKAINKTNAVIPVIGISILTYVFPLIFGVFDFGIIFEVVSLVLLLIARSYMRNQDEIKAKRYIICSIVSISFLLIYDFINMLVSIQGVIDLTVSTYFFLIEEFLIIVYLILLLMISKDLFKADNPEKYEDNTDWFYERYEDNEKK